MEKTISTRVSPDIEQFLVDNFETGSAGLKACAVSMKVISEESHTTDPYKINEELNRFFTVLLYSRRELKGLFSETEWKFLADSLNGTLVDGPFRCNAGALAAHVSDADKFDGTGAKWSVDIPSFIIKIEKLTSAQVEAVYSVIEEFWDNPSDLDDWAQKLS